MTPWSFDWQSPMLKIYSHLFFILSEAQVEVATHLEDKWEEYRYMLSEPAGRSINLARVSFFIDRAKALKATRPNDGAGVPAALRESRKDLDHRAMNNRQSAVNERADLMAELQSMSDLICLVKYEEIDYKK